MTPQSTQPRVRARFQHDVRVIEHTWIPMRDGARLAARIWLPVDAEKNPVPAVMEYIPYRKNDATLPSDVLRHPYFAGHGYASLRVDLRGTGDSDGLLRDEYLVQEQEDALDVLAWLEQQAWCTGAVGMMGYSWGGFNALQVASRRPAQLKAIITVHSTDDRYGGDCHYMGGALLACDMLSWAATAFACNSRPPDPTVLGDEWLDRWRERLEAIEPYVHAWLSHQLDDEYWRHGSVCEDYGAIECAVLTVGGWADPYRDTVFRLLRGLRAPCRGLIGPWAHHYPDEAVPGPQIGFNRECLRWWDCWLKGIDTGVMNEPLLRAYLMDSEAPAASSAERCGRWVGWDDLTSTDDADTSLRYFLDANSLRVEPSCSQETRQLKMVEASALAAGAWCPTAGEAAFPGDQRHDDATSLVFDSAPLSEPLELLGFPEVELQLAVDRPLAQVAVRLCDVQPDGSVALVTRGVLNLTQRDGRQQAEELDPGAWLKVRMAMNSIGYRVSAGHRLRLAVAPAYWPWLWPSPEPVTMTIKPSACVLLLPGLGRMASPVRDFPTAEVASPLETEWLSLSPEEARVVIDRVTNRVELVTGGPDGMSGRVRLMPSELVVGHWGRNTYGIVEGDPLSATVRCERTMEIGRPGWETVTEVDTTMSCDANAFHVVTTLKAHYGDELVAERNWRWSTPRVLG